MSELFNGQSLLTLSAPTGISLSGADVTRILYYKPSGEKGYWEADVNGTSLTYSLADGDIDEAGKWFFQAYIEAAGLVGFGSLKTRIFKNPLNANT